MRIPRFLIVTFPLLASRQTFQAYDSCASSCFDSYIPTLGAQCTETIASQPWIACICQDSIFSIESAVCIYTSCGATILNSTAEKHVSNCNANGSPAAVDAQDFITYGEGGTPAISGTSISLPTAITYSATIPSETTNSPSTSTSTGSGSGSGSSNNKATTTKSSAQDSATQASSSPATSSSASSNGESNTLSTAALVGTIVGSVTGAIGSFAGVYFAWKSYKLKKEEKKKDTSEGQPKAVGT